MLPTVPNDFHQLEQWIQQRESTQSNLKPDNQARLIWANPTAPSRTQYAFVYLHGFTASPGEGEPVHQRLAAEFNANLFVARLPGHGSDDAYAMQGLTATALLQSAAEALAIGRTIGDKVIVFGHSLGAALSLYLAANWPDDIAAMLAWSPGIRATNEAMLRQFCTPGDPVNVDSPDRSDVQRRYWSLNVHRDAYRALATFLENEMTPATFSRVKAPLYMAYYYADETHHDPTASVAAMLEMFDALGTAPTLKRRQAFADAGHVIASPARSAAAEAVYVASVEFLRERLPLSGPQVAQTGLF
jgi:pimeloyl-ACP methyl ester carboxylesterase